MSLYLWPPGTGEKKLLIRTIGGVTGLAISDACCCGEEEPPCEGGWCSWISYFRVLPGSGIKPFYWAASMNKHPCVAGGTECSCIVEGILEMVASIDADAYPEFTYLYVQCWAPYNWAVGAPP